MYEVLDHVTLASGEEMDIGVVTGPDAAWRDHIVPLLGHKGPAWRAQTEWALDGPLDDLVTRFYLGSVGGRPITNVTTMTAGGVGIFGHVYTVPEYRRRGASRAVLARQMAHARAAGVQVLTLVTDPQGHPYRTYAGCGFHDVLDHSGLMLWEATPGAVAALVDHPLGAVRPLRWGDYGMITLLARLPLDAGEELPRSPRLGVNGIGPAESPFMEVQCRRQWEPWSVITWLVVTAHGENTALGWALLAPDEHWFYEVVTLDLYVRPGYADVAEGYRRLLAALPPVPERVVCASAGEGPRAAALRAAGFTVAAELPRWLPDMSGEWHDVRLFTRA